MDGSLQRIGSYTVVDVLGEGGMGTVYLAEQTEPLRRTVALKVIQADTDSERVLRRFEIERQALAVMDHPSIAKVFDAGITEDGRPYVVMERVDGIPIDEYCDARRLTVRQRVGLLAEACRAIHHAHQKGVIHRDLKPAHVLVTDVDGKPTPRIIDFGISIALESEEARAAPGADPLEVVGTPGYMSPEQMDGAADIDTGADVYALGIILYELLVGALPFEPRGGWAGLAAQLQDPPTLYQRLASLDDTQQTVAHDRATTPRRLRGQLRGELDWIVSRAISKDRSRRYQTVHELTLDLERYLAYRAVDAGPGGRVYRARKFVRRHRAGVAFGAVASIGLVGFAVSTELQSRRVAQARDEAQLRRGQAEGLIDFMLSDLRSRLQPLGRLDLLDAVGDQALEYFAVVPEETLSDEELFRRVTALSQIGQVRLDQGSLPAAREAFEESLVQNLDLVARAPENAEWQVGLGAAYFWVGFVDWRIGDLDAALDQFQRYLAISERLVERDSTNLDWQTELAYAHSNIGSVLEARGDLASAQAQFTAALGRFERISAALPDNMQSRLNVAETHNTVGVTTRARGGLAEALQEFREEVRIKQTLVDLEPTNAQWLDRLATGHNYLASTYQMLGEPDSARVHFDVAIEIFSELTARDSTNVPWRRALAMNRHGRALALRATGDLSAAARELSSSGSILRELVVIDPTDPQSKRDQASNMADAARVLMELHEPASALARASSARAIVDDLAQADPGDRDVARVRSETYNVLGAIHADAGDSSAAEDAWNESLRSIAPLARTSNDPRVLLPWIYALLSLGRFDEASPALEKLETFGFRSAELTRFAARSPPERATSAR